MTVEQKQKFLKARICPACGGKLRSNRCIQPGACGRDWTGVSASCTPELVSFLDPNGPEQPSEPMEDGY